ncbi:MAG: hypothetical protein Q9177_000036 [Variospora cf. flavescens]
MIGLDSTQRDQRRTCPICLEDHVTDEHVGIHLQQIALFALPRSTGLEGDSHVDDDASAAAVDDLERDREDGSDTRSFSDEGERPPEAVYGVDYQYVGNTLADLDPYEMAPGKRQIEDDWSVVYNPTLPRELNIEPIQTIQHDKSVWSVKFSCNGDFLAIGLNKFAVVYETKAWGKVFTLEHNAVDNDRNRWVRDVSFDPLERYIATGAADRLIRNHEVVTASWDKTLKVWDLQDIAKPLVPRRTFIGHKDLVLFATFTRDTRWIVSSSVNRDYGAQFWDPTTGDAALRINGHTDGVRRVDASRVNDYFATASFDAVKVWRYRKYQPKSTAA